MNEGERAASCSFASSQSHSLTIFLEFGDQCVAMLDDISILFILVVWSCGLNDALNSVYCAWDSVASDEFGKVSEKNISR
jgi:hypothetical protein